MIYDELDHMVFHEIDERYLPLDQLKIIDAVLASKENPIETALTDLIWEMKIGKEIR